MLAFDRLGDLRGQRRTVLAGLAIAILVGAFGTRERGRALGALSVFTNSGLTAGPPLAGFVTDAVG